MRRSFEEFVGRGSKPVPQRARVTLTRRGKATLNKVAFHLLGGPTAVVLLYDPGTRSIGFRPAGRETPHAYPVTTMGGSSASVTIIAFARHYGVDLSETRTYDATLEDGVLVIDLNAGEPSGRETR